LVSVTDLTDCLWCKRSLWLKKRLGIRTPTFASRRMGVEFHVLVHGMYEHIKKTLAFDIPGKIIGTELCLPKKASLNEVLGLVGRIDVLRQASDGFIVQDEKYSPPPEDKRIHSSHKLQLDAYSFLIEKEGYVPVKSAIIIYKDLVPREVIPNPERVPEYIGMAEKVLQSDILPEKEDKCAYCSYGPLCAILPEKGGLTTDQIMMLKQGLPQKFEYDVIASFPSKSIADVTYTVKRSKTGMISCDCPGWRQYRKCWHIRKVVGTA